MQKLSIFWLMLLTGVAYGQAKQDFVVKPYLQFATRHEITILWETKLPASSRVYVGMARPGADSVVFDRVIDRSTPSLMHEVLVDGLADSAFYFWKTVSYTGTDSLVSEVSTFATAVDSSSAFMFALVGDTQRNPRTPWAWSAIAERVWADRPNFVVHVGDLVDKGLQKSDWVNDFFPAGQRLMSRVPLYPVLGNHEQDSPLYYQYMALPKPEYYYTFIYGNAQFFMIDSNREVDEDSEQYAWLEWALARSTARWKFVLHHHPPYTSDSNDYGDTRYAASELGSVTRNLVPLYEKYKVDFCLYGHTHLYERSWPLRDNRIDQQQGVVYINSGGAGGGIEDFAPTRSWFTAELEAIHHYCTFNIFENTLQFKAIDHEGRLLDVFQLQKPEGGAVAVVQPPAVHIHAAERLFSEQTRVALEAAFEELAIHYTTDGSEPGLHSPCYTDTLTIDTSCLLRARAFTSDGHASRVTSVKLRRQQPVAAIALDKPAAGLQARYYEGDWIHIPDFEGLQPVKTQLLNTVSLSSVQKREDYYGLLLEGYVQLSQTGLQTFYLNSDDGSRLYINGELIIDHDGCHSAMSRSGQAMLQAGWHRIRIEYFERTGSSHLEAGLVEPGLGQRPFHPEQLGH